MGKFGVTKAYRFYADRYYLDRANRDVYLARSSTGLTMPQDVELASGKNIAVLSALTSDHSWSGITATMTAGAALAIGNACYVGGDSKLEKALATGATTMPAIALVTATIAENADGKVLLAGFFRDDTLSLTIGGMVYISKDTAGVLTSTAPSGAGQQVQAVGVAITAKIILWLPNLPMVEI